MIAKTSDLEKQVDGLVNEAKSTDSRVHNVFNDFLMLANTQFIENVSSELDMHVVVGNGSMLCLNWNWLTSVQGRSSQHSARKEIF